MCRLYSFSPGIIWAHNGKPLISISTRYEHGLFVMISGTWLGNPYHHHVNNNKIPTSRQQTNLGHELCQTSATWAQAPTCTQIDTSELLWTVLPLDASIVNISSRPNQWTKRVIHYCYNNCHICVTTVRGLVYHPWDKNSLLTLYTLFFVRRNPLVFNL